MSDYDAASDMQSLRKELGLTDDSSASEVVSLLWAKISGTPAPPSPMVDKNIEQAARALCQHMGDDPGNWMDHVLAAKVVLQAAQPPSDAV